MAEDLETRVLLSTSSVVPLARLGTNLTGSGPISGLAMDAAGNLFGATAGGGTFDAGVIYEIPHGTSTLVPLASFNGANGAFPVGNLAIDANGDLFGMTTNGGPGSGGIYGASGGTVFELAHGSTTITAVAPIQNAGNGGQIALDQSGDIYGLTTYPPSIFEIPSSSSTSTILTSVNNPRGQFYVDSIGDVFGTDVPNGYSGFVYELPRGSTTLQTLVTFNGTNGADPDGIVSNGNGFLYGTDNNGVYRVATDGSNFARIASYPVDVGGGPLISAIDNAGNLYGIGFDGNNSFGSIDEIPADSSTYITLASFTESNSEQNHPALLFLDGSGDLFGTTENAGSHGAGSVYELASGSSTIATIASFEVAPYYPLSLVTDTSGNLFGTTRDGGDFDAGTIFEIPAGSSAVTTLASFTQFPSGQIWRDPSGNIYGVTSAGGTDGDGTIFELPAGSSTITTLASFTGTDGADPVSGVVMDNQGNLFGTTSGGGSSNQGTVFELAKGSSQITALASFDLSTGIAPVGQIVMDTHGDLFGETEAAVIGANPLGTIFEYTPGASAVTVLHSFDYTLNDGGENFAQFTPGGLAVDGSGNLFGTASYGGAYGWGGVFEIPAGTSSFATLLSFDGQSEGRPSGAIDLDAAGNLYTFGGGVVVVVGPLPESSTSTTAAPVDTLNYLGGPLGVTLGSDGDVYALYFDHIATLSSATFSDSAVGTGSDDDITLSQGPDHHYVDWTINGSQPSVLPINDPNGLTINGNGGNDTITLDYSNGNPLPATLHLNGNFTINGLQGADPLAGRTLDIGNSTVYLNYGSPSNDPIFAIRQHLQNGYNKGAWNGSPASAIDGAITSSAAQNNTARTTGVGFADWADGQGVNTVPNTIELKYTLDGDANLDGQVNSADLQILLFGLNRPGSWDQGDFNYDGQVNSADLQSLLFMLNTSLTPPTAEAALAASSAPDSSSTITPASTQAARNTQTARHQVTPPATAGAPTPATRTSTKHEPKRR